MGEAAKPTGGLLMPGRIPSRKAGKRWVSRLAIFVVLAALVLAAGYRSAQQAARDAAQSGPVPGVVIAHSPASAKRYIGSPAIAILPDGSYVAAHDFFGPGSGGSRTLVYRSEDQGATWERVAEVRRQFWSSLFVHRGELYLIGTTGGMGPLVIRRSGDGGRTWTEPRDGATGLLRGGGKFHCAPVPVVEHDGRIWRAGEEFLGRDGRRRVFRAFVMSAPTDADLLRAENWRYTNPLEADFAWFDGQFGSWLEGNVVPRPDGGVANLLRVNYRPGFEVDMAKGEEKAALARLDRAGEVLSFDPASNFVDLPGGGKKFTVRFDARSGLYWSLVNAVNTADPVHRKGNPERVRNTVALVSSPDLRKWTIRSTVLHHPDSERHAFQYIDWLFDGDAIIFVSRTAYDDGQGGAKRQHDANFLTFHRIPDFRNAK